MKKHFLILIIIVLTAVGCGEGFIRPEGNIIQQDFDVTSFHSINIAIPANVSFIQSSERLVEIETNENLFDVIRVQVQNGVLTIDSRPNIRNPKTLNIRLQESDLNLARLSGSGSISLLTCIDTDELVVETSGSGNIEVCGIIDELSLSISGSGRITANDITTTDLTVNTSGSGRANLSGAAENANLRISGSGKIEAYPLQIMRAQANISGSGSMETSVSQMLDVQISGSGNIRYRGNPVVTSKITGSGKLVDAN